MEIPIQRSTGQQVIQSQFYISCGTGRWEQRGGGVGRGERNVEDSEIRWYTSGVTDQPICRKNTVARR